MVLFDSSTPSSPGDYRLQLWTLTNSTIGNYPELLRRSFGGSSGSGDSSTKASYETYNLRTNSTLLNCGSITTDSTSRIRSEIVSGNSTSGLLPLLERWCETTICKRSLAVDAEFFCLPLSEWPN